MIAEGSSKPSRWKPLLVPGASALAVLLVLLSLGNWQLRREVWKGELLAKIDARTGARPVSLADALATFRGTGDVNYLAVRVDGRFRHDRETYLLTSGSLGAGWHVYTPLETNAGQIVLVNRGFVPDGLKDPSRRIEGQVKDRVVVTGLARPASPARPNFFVPDHDLDANVFYWRDLKAMAARSGLEPDAVVPFFVDADASAVPGGWPKGGVTRIVTTNNHRLYAMVWFGLAVVLIGVFIAFSRARLN